MSELPGSPEGVENAVHGRRWYQFSLRTFIGGVTGIALGLGLWKHFSPESFEQCAQYISDFREHMVALITGHGSDQAVTAPTEFAPPPGPDQAINLDSTLSIMEESLIGQDQANQSLSPDRDLNFLPLGNDIGSAINQQSGGSTDLELLPLRPVQTTP